MSRQIRVGVIIEGTIGDSLVLVPTLKMLEQHFPACPVEIISLTNTEAISAKYVLGATFPKVSFSVINNSFEQNIFQRFGAWLALAKHIRRRNLTQVIYAFRPESQRSSSRAKWHKAIVRVFTKSKLYGFDVDKWPLSDKSMSRSDNSISKLVFERVTRSLGIKRQFLEFSNTIEITQSDKQVGRTWLDAQFGDKPKTYYVICVSSKDAAQRWPLDRYLQVVVALHERYNLAPVFIGSARDADTHAELIANLGFGYTSAGLTIGQSSAVIQAALFYLGNDTGPTHLAAALGVQCAVVQSSRSIAGAWDPLGEGHIVHRDEPACVGCELSVCNLTQQLCLTNITVGSVLSSCESILSSKHYDTVAPHL